jgi:hypothetical protein
MHKSLKLFDQYELANDRRPTKSFLKNRVTGKTNIEISATILVDSLAPHFDEEACWTAQRGRWGKFIASHVTSLAWQLQIHCQKNHPKPPF